MIPNAFLWHNGVSMCNKEGNVSAFYMFKKTYILRNYNFLDNSSLQNNHVINSFDIATEEIIINYFQTGTHLYVRIASTIKWITMFESVTKQKTFMIF